MFDWQSTISLVIVALAALAILRRVKAWLAGQAATGCSSCPSRKGDISGIKQLPLANIELKK